MKMHSFPVLSHRWFSIRTAFAQIVSWVCISFLTFTIRYMNFHERVTNYSIWFDELWYRIVGWICNTLMNWIELWLKRKRVHIITQCYGLRHRENFAKMSNIDPLGVLFMFMVSVRAFNCTLWSWTHELFNSKSKYDCFQMKEKVKFNINKEKCYVYYVYWSWKQYEQT